MAEAALSVIRGYDLTPWQRDVMESIETSAEQVGVGNITQAEIAVDRAASMLTAARIKSQRSDADFFQLAVSGLDRIWNQRPDNEGLFKHVTEARIELAMLRVAQNSKPVAPHTISVAPPSQDADVIPAVHSNLTGAVAPASGATSASGKVPDPNGDVRGGGRVVIAAPREITANSILDPAVLGSNYLDATEMPDTAEILMPPARRSFEDNVRVENLTIAGASQTLDAIRWSNVTFVGTRLRYERGPLDLENVHFVGCTFGFPADDHGARLANAIALGQTSFISE